MTNHQDGFPNAGTKIKLSAYVNAMQDKSPETEIPLSAEYKTMEQLLDALKVYLNSQWATIHIEVSP